MKLQAIFCLVFLILLSASAAHAQSVVDPSRLPPDGTWTNIGIQGGIPTDRTQYGSTIAAGASASTVQTALNNAPANSYVLLGSGTFNWSTTIIIPENKTLRGSGSSGANQTTIVNNGTSFVMGNTGGSYPYLDDIYGTDARATLSGGYTKGSSVVVASSSLSIFSVGDLVIITQVEGDSSDGYTVTTTGQGQRLENPNRAPGQITKITNINGSTVTLADKLNYTYQSTSTPQMVRVAPSGTDADYYRAGLEDLYISRPNPSYANSISLWRADQCWVKNVTITKNCSQQGCGSIFLGLSYRSEIQGVYLHHSCTYASGGNGYLLALSDYTSNCLIDNNILLFANEDLFMKMTNGNVIAYNYLDSSWVNEGGSTLMMADYGDHGEWPYMDLFEGNRATKFETGGVWGGSSRQFFFRNYHTARHEWPVYIPGTDPNPTGANTQDRCAFQEQDRSTSQNVYGTYYQTFLGNVGGVPGDTTLNYDSGGYAVFFYRTEATGQARATTFQGYTRNLTNGTTEWGDIPSGSTIRSSYYLTSQPSWWCKETPWPPIGPDVQGYVNDIPAKRRFDGASCTSSSGASLPPPQTLRVAPQ
jgi:hypothetical protein